MTATAEESATASAELEPVLAGAIHLLEKHPETSLEDLAAAVVPAAVPAGPGAPFPPLPKQIELDSDALAALSRVKALFGSVDVEDRRALTDRELDQLTTEATVLRLLVSTFGKRDEVIKEMVRIHMDVAAERAGTVRASALLDEGREVVPASPRDQKGHYLQARPQQAHQVQVGNLAWSQEYSSGAAAPSSALLVAAEASGEVSRKEYLALTQEVRTLDTDKLRAFIRRNPARGLRILRLITRREDPKAALYLRDVK